MLATQSGKNGRRNLNGYLIPRISYLISYLGVHHHFVFRIPYQNAKKGLLWWDSGVCPSVHLSVCNQIKPIIYHRTVEAAGRSGYVINYGIFCWSEFRLTPPHNDFSLPITYTDLLDRSPKHWQTVTKPMCAEQWALKVAFQNLVGIACDSPLGK